MKTRIRRAQEILEIMFPKDLSLDETAEANLFINRLGEVRVECPSTLLEESWKKVDGFLLRKDPPHFNGDSYHIHAKLPGGYEATWSVSGERRHPGKFPAHVPRGVRAAAAQVLGVSPDILECHAVVEDEMQVLILEVRAK